MADLRGFAQTATDPDSIQSKIGQIFGEVRNKYGKRLHGGLLLFRELDEVLGHVSAALYALPEHTVGIFASANICLKGNFLLK